MEKEIRELIDFLNYHTKLYDEGTPIISDKEWDAIQAGAISEAKLTQILNNADIDSIRQRATPRATTTLNAAKINRIKAMKASGYTNAVIAEQMGISASTVSKYMNGKE